MVGRILTAVVGAAIVTTSMLLGMHQVTKHFYDTDPTQYFGIAEFIPGPDGRRRPSPPPVPEAPPDRPQLQYQRSGDARLPLDPPAVDQEAPARPAPLPANPDEARNR